MSASINYNLQINHGIKQAVSQPERKIHIVYSQREDDNEFFRRQFCQSTIMSMPEAIVSTQSRLANTNTKQYDYLLKFLLVGDSDVGKDELLKELDDGATESPYAYSNSGK